MKESLQKSRSLWSRGTFPGQREEAGYRPIIGPQSVTQGKINQPRHPNDAAAEQTEASYR